MKEEENNKKTMKELCDTLMEIRDIQKEQL